MQTFLPYPSFEQSARVLDRQRLGKQRVETLQLVQVLRKGPMTQGKSTAWYSHPAAQMWKGHEECLIRYGITMCMEWKRRGYNDTTMEKLKALADLSVPLTFPDWLGWKEFHRSHQSNLVRKNREHYQPHFPDVLDDLPYIWPTKEKANAN